MRKQDVLGPSATPPVHTSSNIIRSGISPNPNVVQFNLQFTKPNTSVGDIQTGTTISMPCSTDKENSENLGLESKYLKKREDSIPLRGLSQNLFNNPEHQKDGTLGASQTSSKPMILPSTASAYFPGQLPS